METPLQIKQIVFDIPYRFSNIANIVPLCDLRPNEIILFEHACKLVMLQLDIDAVSVPNIPTNIIFLDRDDLPLRFSPKQMGACFIGIYYPVHRWRESNYTDQQIITCMVEEMCHVFWCIKDETLVNFKVLDVLRNGHPELTLESLYPYTREL